MRTLLIYAGQAFYGLFVTFAIVTTMAFIHFVL